MKETTSNEQGSRKQIGNLQFQGIQGKENFREEDVLPAIHRAKEIKEDKEWKVLDSVTRALLRMFRR